MDDNIKDQKISILIIMVSGIVIIIALSLLVLLWTTSLNNALEAPQEESQANKDCPLGEFGLVSVSTSDQIAKYGNIISTYLGVGDYESLYNVNVPREYQSIIKNYDYVDLWLDGNEDNYIISTPLVENIKIYYYLDNADNVITSENKNVASIILDVPVEVNNALEKIADNPDFNIYPVVKSPESVEDITINDIIYSFS